MKFKLTYILISTILFFGFSWPGQKPAEEKKTAPPATQVAQPVSTPAPVVQATRDEKTEVPAAETEKSETPVPAVSPTAADPNAQVTAAKPLADLTSKLVSGDEQETAQRAESMKRLAAALRKLAEQKEQQQQQAKS